MIIRIEDAEDPRIEAYRAVRERDLVGRSGRFIAEGEVVLRTLVSSPLVRPVSLLIAEQRLEKQAEIVERAGQATPVYVAPQAVLDAIAGFPLHRGLLGLGERAETPGDPSSSDATRGADGLVALLDFRELRSEGLGELDPSRG